MKNLGPDNNYIQGTLPENASKKRRNVSIQRGR